MNITDGEMNSRDGFIGRAIVNRPIPLHTYHSMFLLIPIHYILSFSIILFSGLFVFSSFLVSYFSAYFFDFYFYIFLPLFSFLFPFLPSLSSLKFTHQPNSRSKYFLSAFCITLRISPAATFSRRSYVYNPFCSCSISVNCVHTIPHT